MRYYYNQPPQKPHYISTAFWAVIFVTDIVMIYLMFFDKTGILLRLLM